MYFHMIILVYFRCLKEYPIETRKKTNTYSWIISIPLKKKVDIHKTGWCEVQLVGIWYLLQTYSRIIFIPLKKKKAHLHKTGDVRCSWWVFGIYCKLVFILWKESWYIHEDTVPGWSSRADQMPPLPDWGDLVVFFSWYTH